jgi:hypothetical protein
VSGRGKRKKVLGATNAEIRARHEAGESIEELAAALGCTTSTIASRIQGVTVKSDIPGDEEEEERAQYILAIAGVGRDCLVKMNPGQEAAERMVAVCGRPGVVLRRVRARYVWDARQDAVCADCASIALADLKESSRGK